MSAEIRVHEKRSPEARCAFCHGDLDGPVSNCGGCGTVFHDDCRMHLVKCPTLGCATPLRSEGHQAAHHRHVMWTLMGVRTVFHVVGFVAGLACLVLFATLVPQRKPECLVPLLGGLGLLVWAGRALAGEPSFYRGVSRVLETEAPAPMSATVRRDGPGESARTFVDLVPTGPGLAPLSVEITSSFGLGWLVDAPPGSAVLVYGARGTGPVVLRRRQNVHAVPAAQVTRG